MSCGWDSLTEATLTRTKRPFLRQFLDRAGAAVAHAGPQAADELIDEVAQRAAVGDPAFDAFGDELAGSVVLHWP